MNRVRPCRSLLAGDSPRVAGAGVPNRLQASSYIGLLGLVVMSGFAAEPADRQGLVDKSPFGQPAAAPAAAEADLEFRGVVEEDGVTLINLYDPASKRSFWVPVQGKVSGVEVKSYDAAAGRVAVSQGSRTLTLSLKHGNELLAKPTSETGESTKDKAGVPNDSRKDAARETPGAFRNLTPEAQAIVDEFRRRRAERAAAAQPNPSIKKN